MTSISRRQAIQIGLAASTLAFIPILRQRVARGADQISAQLPPRYTFPFKFPPLASDPGVATICKQGLPIAGSPFSTPYTAQNYTGGLVEPIGFTTRDVYQIDIKRALVDILGNGQKTQIWGYGGRTPGPTIKVQKGTEVLVRMRNSVDQPDVFGNTVYTSCHLHGMASLPPFDGWANDITLPDEEKDYYYPNNRPATHWYHDHGVHRTAYNAYCGLAAMYIVEDPNEIPGLPKTYGVNDFPVMLGDKIFDANGQLVFDETMVTNEGLHGDVILVNGVPWPTMTVEPKPYRFRMLSTGISRAYNYVLSNGGTMYVIGTDGGLLEKAVPVRSLRAGPAERYEVVIDFSQYAGQTFELRNAGLKNHPDYLHTNKIMQFKVKQSVSSGFLGRLAPNDKSVDPTAFRDSLNRCRRDAFNYSQRIAALRAYGIQTTGSIPERTMVFERKNGVWTINGRTWENGVNSIEANPRSGGIEIWRLKNNSGGWNHPIHLHLVDFLLMSRTGGNSPGVKEYEKGFKDVTYLGENEEITIITIFGPHDGKYMFHCHNLIHEDDDMMRAFNVGGNGIEPVGTDGTSGTRGQGPYDAKPIGTRPPL